MTDEQILDDLEEISRILLNEVRSEHPRLGEAMEELWKEDKIVLYERTETTDTEWLGISFILKRS
jgi:tRNA G37 N-methylase Trm5